MDCSTSGDLARAPQPPRVSPEEVAVVETQPPHPSLDLAGIESDPAGDAFWRSEVAARLERYRSRRKPRGPRYPSLRLPFDSAEDHSFSASPPAPRAITAIAALSEQNVAVRSAQLAESEALSNVGRSGPNEAATLVSEPPTRAILIEYETSNLIEFPRSAAIPVFRGSELAEPVLDRPRIVEAPEVIPPPPALGGILMETAPSRETERPVGNFAQAPASLARRLAASAMDVLILLAALAGFAAIFHRINPGRLPIPLIATSLVAVAGMFWLAYEFLFVVYIGSTPGWRIAHLRLTKFDGSPVRRGLRRYRVLASFLSAFSLGLGYLWSVLDEDGLCWHDRITHTYLELSIPAK